MLPVRDYPWHERIASHGHQRLFHFLTEIHDLTQAWLKELQTERPPYLMGRGLNREVASNLPMLDLISERRLEAILDDTHPEEFLIRLEQTVWAVQAYTISKLRSQVTGEERAALDTILEQVSWQRGRAAGEARWHHMLEGARADLRQAALVLYDVPFYSPPSIRTERGPFLAQRLLRADGRLELLACAHQVPWFEAAAEADQLCRLHHQWVKGFLYSISPRIRSELESPRAPHCLLHLQLAEASA